MIAVSGVGFSLLLLACFAMGGAIAQSKASKVGELNKIVGWINKMPPGPPSITVKGQITAPTPCHEAAAQYVGEKSNPPTYQIKISLHQKPGNCIQRLDDIPFYYSQPNYAGSATRVEVSSDQDSKTEELGTAS